MEREGDREREKREGEGEREKRIDSCSLNFAKNSYDLPKLKVLVI